MSFLSFFCKDVIEQLPKDLVNEDVGTEMHVETIDITMMVEAWVDRKARLHVQLPQSLKTGFDRPAARLSFTLRREE